MKYKVGDRVRIVAKKTGPDWANEMERWLGKVMTIEAAGIGLRSGYYLMREDKGGGLARQGYRWRWYDHMIAGLAEEPESIHITRDGNTVHAVYKRGGEVAKRADAKCAPGDPFDFLYGVRLALARLIGDSKSGKTPMIGANYQLFAGAVDRFGADSQIDMAIEEMAELTVALNKYKRLDRWGQGETAQVLAAVAEERADVQIMLNQLEAIFGKNAEAMRAKLRHLAQIVSKEDAEHDD